MLIFSITFYLAPKLFLLDRFPYQLAQYLNLKFNQLKTKLIKKELKYLPYGLQLMQMLKPLKDSLYLLNNHKIKDKLSFLKTFLVHKKIEVSTPNNFKPFLKMDNFKAKE